MNTKLKFIGRLGLTVAMLCGVRLAAAQPQNQQAIGFFALGLKEKEPQKKIAAYTKAVELDPQFVEALYNLGLAYRQAQEHAQAERFFLRALEARPERTKNETKVQILQELARTEALLGKIQEQESYLRGAKGLAAEPAVRATIIWELGSALYEQGRYEDALVELQEGQLLSSQRTGEFAGLALKIQGEIERESTDSILARYYAEGVAAMHQHDLGRALAALEKVQKLNAGYRNTAALLQEIENGLAQPAAALPTPAAVNADSLYRAALSAQERKDWMQALITFEKLQILQPGYRDAAQRLDAVRRNLRSAAAASTASEGSAQWGTVAGVLATIVGLPALGFFMFSPAVRARYYMMRSDYTAAMQIYEKILTRHPQRTNVYSALANLYILLGQRDERALKVFKTILQLNLATPHRDHINAIVAEHFLTEGRTDSDAIAVLESALEVERRRLRA